MRRGVRHRREVQAEEPVLAPHRSSSRSPPGTRAPDAACREPAGASAGAYVDRAAPPLEQSRRAAVEGCRSEPAQRRWSAPRRCRRSAGPSAPCRCTRRRRAAQAMFQGHSDTEIGRQGEDGRDLDRVHALGSARRPAGHLPTVGRTRSVREAVGPRPLSSRPHSGADRAATPARPRRRRAVTAIRSRVCPGAGAPAPRASGPGHRR